MKNQVIMLAALLATGCASMQNTSQQSIIITTQNDISDKTTCTASNEEGTWKNITPGNATNIHRDGNPLLINCQNEQQQATGKFEPEFNGHLMAMDFILIDACIISCMIDGANNAFYEYPTPLLITFPQP
jgi:hypothetical protein